jgi:hypothetical protein
MTFEVGQKIRCIRSESDWLHIGRIYTCDWITDDGYVYLKEVAGGWLPSRFVPAGLTQAEKDAKELAALERDEIKDREEINSYPGYEIGDELVCVHESVSFGELKFGATYRMTDLEPGCTRLIKVEGLKDWYSPGRFRKAPERPLTFADLKPGDWFHPKGDPKFLHQKAYDGDTGHGINAWDPYGGGHGSYFEDSERVVRVKVKITVEKS